MVHIPLARKFTEYKCPRDGRPISEVIVLTGLTKLPLNLTHGSETVVVCIKLALNWQIISEISEVI